MDEYVWEYDVEFEQAKRWYKNPDNPDGHTEKQGTAWILHRSTKLKGRKPFRQALIASPEVFTDQYDAEQDLLVKLSLLRCRVELPLDKAIREIVERM